LVQFVWEFRKNLVSLLEIEAPIMIRKGILGQKHYHLSNHLGSVLSVVTDRKTPISDDNTTVSGYLADIKLSMDYSPYGVILDGRNFKQQICTDVEVEVEQTAVATVLNSTFSNSTEDYQFSEHTTISLENEKLKVSKNTNSQQIIRVSKTFDVLHEGSNFKINLDFTKSNNLGADVLVKVNNVAYAVLSANNNYTLENLPILSAMTHTLTFETNAVIAGNTNANKHFTIDNVVITYEYLEIITEVVQNCVDGVNARGRYSFQGQEHDDEISGEGNYINFKYRGYNPRLGRFFQVDPLTKEYPANSPYAFSENVVINAIELEGLEKVHVYNKFYDGKAGEMATKYSHTYIDNRLKENINQVNNFGGKGKIDSKTYKPIDKENSQFQGITVKTGTEYKNDHTQYFKSEKSGPLYTPIDTRSAPDATHHDSWEGSRGADKYIGVIDAIGDGLQYSKLPGIVQIGEGFSIAADAMSTAKDFESKDISVALSNLFVRASSNVVGRKIGDKIEGSKLGKKDKYISNQISRKQLDFGKDGLIKE
jgi:RHS repeat-associated protein